MLIDAPSRPAAADSVFGLFAVFAVFFLAFYLKTNESFSRLSTGTAVIATIGLLAAGRRMCAAYIHRRTGGKLVYDLLITDEVQVTPPPGMHVLDTRADNLLPDMRDPHMLNRLGLHLKEVDRVVIACPPERRQLWAMMLKGSRGFRGETREREDLANRFRADLEYLNGWTIWRDLSILASTLRVLVHRNAY